VRRRIALLALALAGAGCPGGDTHVFSASYSLNGQPRSIDDRSGGRVTCTVDNDPRNLLDSTPTLTLAVTSAMDGTRGPGLYFTVSGFTGTGSYKLGGAQGEAVVFDNATLADCARSGDDSCFSSTDACSLEVTTWDLGSQTSSGERVGTGAGTIACDKLSAPGKASRKLENGVFKCRATDWTATRK
jgi:hypothetical protein